MRTSDELREGFLSFFEEKGHLRVPSASLVPRADDQSSLLTTAGMQPQMPYFLGLEPPPAPFTTTSQKCFRTVDIDEVGLDGHHLTFFEMLGNFSFGQYFKEGAIAFATEFIQERMQLDWDRVWVTVHAGDPQLKLGPDTEAIELWTQIGMPPERIVPLPTSENFWSVGGPGPCGPDSEIYWDWGEEHGCGEPDCAPACTRCHRFLEFWNLVFMAYEQHPDGTLTPLPTQNIDTGLGLERGAAILQDVRTVYENDGYQRIMAWIEAESGVAYGDSDVSTKAHRILADHGRGMTFLVADGVTPSNESRGYVLRRIIRRAVIQAQRIGLAALHPLTGVVVEQMGHAYPELRERADEIAQVVRTEEERFQETLDRGMRLFDELAEQGRRSPARTRSRSPRRTGFPLELTVELAEERGRAVDVDGYHAEMEQHREVSRAGVEGDVQRAAEFTRAAGFETEFVGYAKTDVLTQIGALERLDDGRLPREAARVAVLRGRRRPGQRPRVDRARRRVRDPCRARRGVPVRRRPGPALPRRRVLRGCPRACRGPLERALSDDGEPHGDARAPPGAAGHARRPRAPGGLGRAPGQAALRLHARACAHGRGTGAGRADREREGLPEPPGARVRDADRGGPPARRDDALRREVRRHRPRGRDPGLLDRALRRHAREVDGRDRAVRRPLRGLGRGPACAASRP